jgi:hypothetical protein
MAIAPDSILSSMPVNLLRRILALLIVTAYVGATLMQVVPTYAANANMSASSISAMMHEQDGPGHKMPCKDMLPGCVTDLGCIFLVSLPAPDLRLVTVTAWSSVFYDTASEGLRGRSIKPALGPPIFLA